MNEIQFAETVLNMPAEKREAFFETLKTKLSEEDYLTTAKFISFIGMFKSPAKYEAMKNAVCDQLCEEFHGHTVERKKKIEDPCNPVFMTTIL